MLTTAEFGFFQSVARRRAILTIHHHPNIYTHMALP